MKVSKAILLIFLILLFLLFLFPLWAFLQGAMVGSLEMFPRSDDISAKRFIYILITGGVLLCELVVGYAIIRVVKFAKRK